MSPWLLAALPALAQTAAVDGLPPLSDYDSPVAKPGTRAWELARWEELGVRSGAPEMARGEWLALVREATWTHRPFEKRKLDGVPTGFDYDNDGVEDWRDLCPSLQEPLSDQERRWLDDGTIEAADGCPDDGSVESWVPRDSRDAQKGSYVAPPEPPADDTWSGAGWGDGDGDGVPDDTDLCPGEPEDYDGFQDADGCPDPDNDADGILDWTDRCPNEPEVVNSFEDDDGCPDQGGSSAPVSTWRPEPVAIQAPPPVPSGPPPPPSIDGRLTTGQRHPEDAAVVVGIEDYLDPQLPDVAWARRDADAFTGFLTYARGVPSSRIHVLSSAAKEHLLQEVERAGREVGPGGRVWIYFAGHGAAHPEDGRRMLLGDDVRADMTSFAARSVLVEDLERLAAAGGGQPVLILDACFTGRGRGGGQLLATRFAIPTYAATTAGTRSVQWNAADANQAAGPLDAARHGAFTYFVVGAMRGWADGELTGSRDGKVTAEEAQAYVQRALRAYQVRDQRPIWLGPDDLVLSEGATEAGPELP